MDPEFKVGNLVMVATLSSSIEDLGRLFKYIVVHYHDYTVGTKLAGMGRETVPYFGNENVIVGLKHGTEQRGIVRLKGHLFSLIGIDIQIHGKNYNLKLSQAKIQLTGAKSQKNGIETFNALINHLHMTHTNSVRLMEVKDKDGMYEWIENNVDMEDYKSMFKQVDRYPIEEDRHALQYLLIFAQEYNDRDNYLDKVKSLLSMTEPALGNDFNNIMVEQTTVCNGLYTYPLGKKISLIKLSHYLSGLTKENGNNIYGISFHNWASNTRVNVVVPIKLSDDDSPNPNSEEAKKLQSHRFSINQSGSTKQNSPTSPEKAYEQYVILKRHFNAFINKH